MTAALSRAEIEDFLFFEAELLDEWRLPEWAELFTEDAAYEITSPTTPDPRDADPSRTLFLVSDRIDRIRARAVRLMKKTAHAEYPHSKTRHNVTNVRLVPTATDEIRLRANLVVYRTKEDTTTIYMGESWYSLIRSAGSFRILQKRVILDLNSLYSQGRLTIIL